MVSAQLEAILIRALKERITDRYQTYRELQQDLKKAHVGDHSNGVRGKLGKE